MVKKIMLKEAVRSFMEKDKQNVLTEMLQAYGKMGMDLTVFMANVEATGLELVASTVWSGEERQIIQNKAESAIRYYGSRTKEISMGRGKVRCTRYHPLKTGEKTMGLLVEECLSDECKLQKEDVLLINTAFELYFLDKQKQERDYKDIHTGMWTLEKLIVDNTDNQVLALLKMDSLYQLAKQYGMETMNAFTRQVARLCMQQIPSEYANWYQMDKNAFLAAVRMDLIDVMERSEKLLEGLDNLEHRPDIRISILAGRNGLEKDICVLEESFCQKFEGCIVILPTGEVTDYMEKLEEKHKKEEAEKQYDRDKEQLLRGGALETWSRLFDE